MTLENIRTGNYWLASSVLMAALLACISTANPANAQYKMQTPEGGQTVAPSDMSQQPPLGREFAESVPTKNKVNLPAFGRPDLPGIIIKQAQGRTAKPPALSMPEGFSSTTRIGPLQPVPLVQRAALALFLMIQFAAMIVVAVVLQITSREKDELYRGGHLIDEGHRENRAEWARTPGPGL